MTRTPALPARVVLLQTVANGVKIVKKLHAAGFQVHIYTLRNEPK